MKDEQFRLGSDGNMHVRWNVTLLTELNRRAYMYGTVKVHVLLRHFYKIFLVYVFKHGKLHLLSAYYLLPNKTKETSKVPKHFDEKVTTSQLIISHYSRLVQAV